MGRVATVCVLAGSALLTLAVGCAQRRSAQEPTPAAVRRATTTAPADVPRAPSGTRIELRESALLELHMLVRQCATGRPAPPLAGMDQALDAAGVLQRKLPGVLGWGLIEATISSCDSAADLRREFENLPDRLTTRGGATLEIRSEAVALADAYAALEPSFRATEWPEHRAQLAAAKAMLIQRLRPYEAACFADILASLGMADPQLSIPVYLVLAAPPPQAFTYLSPGGAVCVVSASEFGDGMLCEAVLHEAIHALDAGPTGGTSALAVLRARLGEAGVSPRDAALRDVPHLLIFVQAAETVRRVIDPAHQHYGRVSGYYAKAGRMAEVVIGAWGARLDGRQSIDEAVVQIIRAARPTASAGSGD